MSCEKGLPALGVVLDVLDNNALSFYHASIQRRPFREYNLFIITTHGF
jgi:hypothetical protein